MNKNKVAMLAAVALSTLGLSFSAVSAADSTTAVKTDGGMKAEKFGGGSCKFGNCGKGGGGGFKALGITDDQLEKLNTLKNDFSASSAPKKAELMTLSRELRDNMTKPGVTKSQLVSLQTKINSLRDELSIGKVGYMADRMAVLTDDQKAKIRSFALHRSFGPGGHGGPGKHFRGGKKFHHGPGKGHFGGVKPTPNTPNQA